MPVFIAWSGERSPGASTGPPAAVRRVDLAPPPPCWQGRQFYQSRGRGLETVSGTQWPAAVEEGLYRVRNVGSGLLLEVADGRRNSGANVQQGVDNGTDAQIWRVVPIHDGSALYHLENVRSGKRLDVAGAATENGVNVQQWRPNNFGAQEWLIEQHLDAPGTVTLLSGISGKTLEVADGSKENGANVQQWEDKDVPSQWWTLEPQ